jgi:hypothetical protein
VDVPAPRSPRQDGMAVLMTDQSRDSFIRASLGSRAHVRLLYQRCAEARTQSLPGQDYARLVATAEGDTICFCVCDGVGSSYRGDFAARFLAEHVVAWLCELSRLPEQVEPLASTLREELARWAKEAQNTLLTQALPAAATGLVAEVLHELREEYGGEAVFLAGRMTSPHVPFLPWGNEACVEALFCSLGNVAGQVLAEGERSDLAASGDGNRWSSARSLRGHLRVWRQAPDHLERLIVYTEGARDLRPHLAVAGDAELRERAAALLATPGSDDVTILDIAWRSGAPKLGEVKGDHSRG